MADKIVVMRDGRVEQVGAPLDLYDRPLNTFVAGFIGSPAMNFLKGRSTAAAAGLPRRRRRPAAAAGRRRRPGRAVVYGIRPEHIDIGEGGVRRGSRCSSRPARRPRSSPGIGERLDRRHGQGPPEVKPGDEIPFRIDPRRVHVFDGASGART